MIRQAGPEDAAAIDAFLQPYAETSMFLRGNLVKHGIGQTDHPHSTDFFLWDSDGVRAVFGHTKAGFLMGQAPDAGPDVFAGFATTIAARNVAGMTGASDQVPRVLAALGIPTEALALDAVEPLYRLDLPQLSDPEGDLRPASEADIPILSAWYRDYMVETGTLPGGADPGKAGQTRANRAIGGELRIFFEKNGPVAMASINAEVGDMVQLGGVYVPPDYRRQGFGAKVSAARLAEARAKGAKTGILFAANPEAARVYERIGFCHIGAYRIALLKSPMKVRP